MSYRGIVQTPGSSAPICGDGRNKRTAATEQLMRARRSGAWETRNPDQSGAIGANDAKLSLRGALSITLPRRASTTCREHPAKFTLPVESRRRAERRKPQIIPRGA